MRGVGSAGVGACGGWVGWAMLAWGAVQSVFVAPHGVGVVFPATRARVAPTAPSPNTTDAGRALPFKDTQTSRLRHTLRWRPRSDASRHPASGSDGVVPLSNGGRRIVIGATLMVNTYFGRQTTNGDGRDRVDACNPDANANTLAPTTSIHTQCRQIRM